MKQLEFDVAKVIEYARDWALLRNPVCGDFEKYGMGGDCTNFVSQRLCVVAE